MQIEILSMTKPEKGNVKITANVLNPRAVPSDYKSQDYKTVDERDERTALLKVEIDKRINELNTIARLHLGKAELTQEVNE